MNLTISTEDSFVPSFQGNKDLPPTDQIVVRYRMPTLAMRNRCVKKPQAKGIAKLDGKMEHMEIFIEKDGVAVLTEMLISISNCSSTDAEGKTKSITNTQELLNASVMFGPLMEEIITKFERILSGQDIDEKN